MPGKISIHKWVEEYWEDIAEADDGEDKLLTALNYYSDQGTIPALCRYGCEVELDGVCEHGNPSPLIKLGLI
jgi:hypothetical protein